MLRGRAPLGADVVRTHAPFRTRAWCAGFAATLVVAVAASFSGDVFGWSAVTVSGFAWITSAVVAVPLLSAATLGAGESLAQRSGIAARLAFAAARSAPRRAAIAIATLAVAEAIAVGLAAGDASSQRAIRSWADSRWHGDFDVRPLGGSDAGTPHAFPDSVVARVAGVTQVAQVEASRSLLVPYR